MPVEILCIEALVFLDIFRLLTVQSAVSAAQSTAVAHRPWAVAAIG